MSIFSEGVVAALQDPIFIAIICMMNSLLILLLAKRFLRDRLRLNSLEDAVCNLGNALGDVEDAFSIIPERKFVLVIMDNDRFGFRCTRGTNDNL